MSGENINGITPSMRKKADNLYRNNLGRHNRPMTRQESEEFEQLLRGEQNTARESNRK